MKLAHRFFAVCVSVCTLISALTVNAFAAKSEKKDMLPCGRPLSWLENEINNTTIDNEGKPQPAFSTVIFQGDEIKYRGTFGEIDLKNNIPADDDTVYEWGSVTKTTIWVSAMQLWEQGRLDLNRDIREYLPDGFLHHLQYDDPITFLNLMNHNAGWSESTYAFGTKDAAKVRPLGQVLQDTEPAQVFRPGEVCAYSNWGAALGGYIIECITGESFADYVRENIFARLGMEHTAILPDHSDNAWVCEQRKKEQCYETNIFGMMRALGGCNTYVELYPAGAATGTIDDFLIYVQAFVDDSAPLFDSPATQEELFSATAYIGESDVPAIAHGFFPSDYAVTVYGHSGATLGFTANMWFDRESKYGYISMTNQKYGNYAYDWIQGALFGEIPEGKYGSDQSGEESGFLGYYLSSRGQFSGFASIYPYINATHMNNVESVYSLGNDLYCTADGRTLVAEKHYSNGRMGIGLGGGDYIKDPLYPVKLTFFAVNVLLALIALFVLLAKRRLIKAGRLHQSAPDRILSIGQLGNIISVILLIVSPSFAVLYGIPKPLGIAVCIGQMLCLAALAASAAASVIRLTKQSSQKWRYISGAVCSLLSAASIVIFSMYQFWNC